MPNNFELPKPIERLGELAYNLWWTWEKDAQSYFRMINGHLWEETYHNPVQFLRSVGRADLNRASQDRYMLDFYKKLMADFDEYMAAQDTWFKDTYPNLTEKNIAYFSTEFGLHETLPIYSGGLGVLSGDHVKEASDLGLPFVGIGFLYTEGYFSQHITEDGWQESHEVHLKFEDLPVMPLLDDEDKPLTISVELPGRTVLARLWEIRVGRVPLYLLDSDVEGNSDTDRKLTARLYSSDLDLRISQELILGVGGVRALRLLGYDPSVWHMNEGHSAFMALERARELVSEGMAFDEAVEQIKSSNVFTTHTPVPAGNEEFPTWLMDKYFSNLWPQLSLDREGFMDLARREQDWGETFSLSVLALRMAEQRNGVSELHGRVAREMWHFLWPERKLDEVPITHITNGVHTGTWLARRYRHLYDEYFGEGWWKHVDDPAVWEKVDEIPDEKLWSVHEHLKRKLTFYMRDRARQQWTDDGVHPVQVVAAGTLLDPYTLTIGFARRFATYKRAGLVLSDLDRLLKILNEPNRPVQIVFAGKAHPADEPGKQLIQEVYRKVKAAENGGRLVFLEDYDMNLGRYLTQGVDVWLNTPRKPNEASGTSGEKAALNGVLNFSILDGWWREGYNGNNGWAIGEDEEHNDPNVQDQADANSLYDILENEIIPLYYEGRSGDNIPREWIAKMKECIRTLAPRFSMTRMIKEYTEELYVPVIEGKGELEAATE
ncbi:MAG: alpha-glucan family phosphorylase [Chloroflexi bacterium]|nr:MAG: alpha-glucan family phosphorylase [Chloroflexota bacterium]MBL1196266.1 alpha-glucan family phosphorylase [Chloroflexota bacterium]NOH13561.1 alpha-glucan family phosphorylase [Chloroflexota bacterium]